METAKAYRNISMTRRNGVAEMDPDHLASDFMIACMKAEGFTFQGAALCLNDSDAYTNAVCYAPTKF